MTWEPCEPCEQEIPYPNIKATEANRRLTGVLFRLTDVLFGLTVMTRMTR